MKLLILGAGEYGQLVKELARNEYLTIDFLDDNSDKAVGKLEDYRKLVDEYKNAIVAIGNNKLRLEWLSKLKEVGYNLPSLISDKAYVSKDASVENGVIIEPMAVININASISRGSIISSGAVVNHNAIVNEGCHIDCNAVVGAGTIVPSMTNLRYCEVITRNQDK